MKYLNEIGERKAIECIKEILYDEKNNIEIGDDCAVLNYGEDFLLVTTDMITEMKHIPNIMSAWQIGWFITAINLSDIAAKGGFPIGLVLGLSLPGNKSETFLRDVIYGAKACADRYNTFIIGGDTKENTNITISGTAIGQVSRIEFMSRKGMTPGEIVAVTGSLGGAGAGFNAYKNEIEDKNIFKKFLEPCPRVFEGIELAKSRLVTSCMDISDGLSSSLYQLSNLNEVGFELFKNKIPLSEFGLKLTHFKPSFNVLDCALHCGGDYELLLTVQKNDFANLKNKMRISGFNLFDIGIVTKEKNIIINSSGKKNFIENKGYEHFI